LHYKCWRDASIIFQEEADKKSKEHLWKQLSVSLHRVQVRAFANDVDFGISSALNSQQQ
jgi:hypothetical protein